jgi:hypothetical protein
MKTTNKNQFKYSNLFKIPKEYIDPDPIDVPMPDPVPDPLFQPSTMAIQIIATLMFVGIMVLVWF